MSVTVDSIKQLVDRYYDYGKNPAAGIDLKLVNGIAKGLKQTGGDWDFDDKNPVISCFEGLTKLCWHFSSTKGADAAVAYTYFVLRNYNLWYNMPFGTPRDNFRSSCHSITDTLKDWTAITKEVAPRQTILQEAINVTSGMYGASAAETASSEKLWNGR